MAAANSQAPVAPSFYVQPIQLLIFNLAPVHTSGQNLASYLSCVLLWLGATFITSTMFTFGARTEEAVVAAILEKGVTGHARKQVSTITSWITRTKVFAFGHHFGRRCSQRYSEIAAQGLPLAAASLVGQPFCDASALPLKGHLGAHILRAWFSVGSSCFLKPLGRSFMQLFRKVEGHSASCLLLCAAWQLAVDDRLVLLTIGLCPG